MQSPREFFDGGYTITRLELDSGASTPITEHQAHAVPATQQPLQVPTRTLLSDQVADGSFRWQGPVGAAYDGVPSPAGPNQHFDGPGSACVNIDMTGTDSSDDDVDCLLHAMGEWCSFCGDMPETAETEKYSGKHKVVELKRLDLGSLSGSLFDDICFSTLTSQNWIPGLAGPAPQRSQVRPRAYSGDDCCGKCGALTSLLMVKGPGFCVECRSRWLEMYHAQNALAAGVRPAKSKFAKAYVGKSKKSRYDWRALGY